MRKSVGGYLFFAQSSRAVSGEIARCPLLSIPGLSNLEFCYQLIISSVKSNQAVQKSSTAWKTCVEMLYYCIFSQLRSTCDNCTVTLVVDILGICYSSYSMILLKNEKENYFCYKCNAYHVFHVFLNSAQLVTTAPSRSLSIVRIF